MQEDIPAFAEWEVCDKVEENQGFQNGEHEMNTLIFKEFHIAENVPASVCHFDFSSLVISTTLNLSI